MKATFDIGAREIIIRGKHTTEMDLLHICKQLRHETTPLFYSHATFRLSFFGEIKDVYLLDPELCARLSSIELYIDETFRMAVRGHESIRIARYMEYARRLPKLRRWSAVGECSDFEKTYMEEGIKAIMGRGVEIIVRDSFKGEEKRTA
jgi:hypothetical protein